MPGQCQAAGSHPEVPTGQFPLHGTLRAGRGQGRQVGVRAKECGAQLVARDLGKDRLPACYPAMVFGALPRLMIHDGGVEEAPGEARQAAMTRYGVSEGGEGLEEIIGASTVSRQGASATRGGATREAAGQAAGQAAARGTSGPANTVGGLKDFTISSPWENRSKISFHPRSLNSQLSILNYSARHRCRLYDAFSASLLCASATSRILAHLATSRPYPHERKFSHSRLTTSRSDLHA